MTMNIAVAARERPVDTRGLMPCCRETLRTAIRSTRPGDRLRCPSCLELMEVTPDGRWHWLRED